MFFSPFLSRVPPFFLSRAEMEVYVCAHACCVRVQEGRGVFIAGISEFMGRRINVYVCVCM